MKRFYLTILFALILSTIGFAQQIPFQGRLLDNDRPFNGTATIDFSIASPVWSETKSNVPVVDGYYSVVLGSTTPLPDTLFGDSREILLNITVNGEDLGSVILHSPLLPYTSDGPIGIDSIETQSISMNNTLGFEAVSLIGRAQGGYFQLTDPDPTNNFLRSFVATGTSANVGTSFLTLGGFNAAEDDVTAMVNLYITGTDVFGNPFSDSFRRGGIDLSDNDGRLLSALGINRDESGGDPTGKSGLMLINGPTTRNVYVSGQWWANSELGIVQVFGQNDNGAGDFSSNVEIVADDQAGETSGRISIMNTANGGTVNETILISSNSGSGGGFIDIRDNGGANTIGLDGQNGNISVTGDVAGNTLTSSDGMVQTSDRRLKKNIINLEDPLQKTLKMRGVSYQWKDEAKSQRNQIGVIAQEVEEIYPEFVITNSEGMKAVNYAQMTAVLIEAVKVLNAKVEQLESENADLRASLEEVKTLKSQVDNLMKVLGSSKASGK
ncbi:MAG: tail fiber domain-containing protein [Ekhidna sp.]